MGELAVRFSQGLHAGFPFLYLLVDFVGLKVAACVRFVVRLCGSGVGLVG